MPASRPETPGPSDKHSTTTVDEFRKAAVWIGLAVAVALFVLLIQPQLPVFNALVFAAMLDGGAARPADRNPRLPAQ